MPRAGRYWSIKSGSLKLIEVRHWKGVGNFTGARPGPDNCSVARANGLASVSRRARLHDWRADVCCMLVVAFQSLAMLKQSSDLTIDGNRD
jgi:hypothetical protein